ncbi:MAG TPA: hypothetical protein VE621_18055 [Bryobacteraceae bacterium]|jgi:hypothetical protein|nr:hypothetical protein [Bryobacteraceae bacterium]
MRIFLPVLLLLQTCFAIDIVQVRRQEYENGPDVSSVHAFRPGETVHLSFQVSGYARTDDEDAPKVHLSYTITAKDPKGAPLEQPKKGQVETVLAPEDKNWMPKVRYQLVLPESPPGGTYQLEIRVKDEISGAEDIQREQFVVEAPPVEAADTLSIRQFRYLRSDKERDVIGPNAAIRPGDKFYARFLIVGYKLGERNMYNVRYGIAFLDPTGKPIFADADAGAAQGESFYPRRYVPVSIEMKIDPNVKPGIYRLKIDLEDLMGAQKLTQEFPISVER